MDHESAIKYHYYYYFTLYLKKVLLAWIFNIDVNCGTPCKQAEMNALRYV